MTEQAAEARRAYKRKWAADHPEKVKEYQRRYWTKKGAEAAASEAETASRSDTEQEGGKKN
jgi:hypothetical protein